MNICYIFPSRSRPDKFFNVLDNIKNLSAKESYSIIASLDADDVTMNNMAVIERMMPYDKVNRSYMYSTGKVNAINKNLDLISLLLLFLSLVFIL